MTLTGVVVGWISVSRKPQSANWPDLPYRIYVGYAGWGSGQLENEIAAGAWIATNASADYIFFEPEDLWRKVSKDITDSVIHLIFKPEQIPDDPSLN